MTERRVGLSSLVLVSILGACNALIDNDPRTFDPEFALGGSGGRPSAVGGRPFAGDFSAGAGGRDASAGASGGPSEAGSAGSESGAGGAGNACDTGECMPGDTDMQTEPCGDCSLGSRTRSATCSASCRWQWGAFGACVNTKAQCKPAETATQTASCPCSGSKTQRRTCSTGCMWGAWSDTSACNLECCTSVRYCDTPNDLAGVPASRGTWCRQETLACTQAQVVADCTASLAQVDCVMKPELYIEYL